MCVCVCVHLVVYYLIFKNILRSDILLIEFMRLSDPHNVNSLCNLSWLSCKRSVMKVALLQDAEATFKIDVEIVCIDTFPPSSLTHFA